MTGATSDRGKMKKLTRSRPTCPACGSAMSITVRPIEMSKCPASSNSVQGGLVSSRGRSLVGVAHSASLRPRNRCSTWPSSTSRMPTVSSYEPIGASSGGVQLQAPVRAPVQVAGELVAGDEPEGGGRLAGQSLRPVGGDVALGDAAAGEGVEAAHPGRGGAAVDPEVAPGPWLLGADLDRPGQVAGRGELDGDRRLLVGVDDVEDDGGEPRAHLDVVERPAGRLELEAGHDR